MGATFREELDQRIAALTRLRDQLDGCIGCGCLSLKRCALYNRDDRAAVRGAGPRYLMGDAPERAGPGAGILGAEGGADDALK